jgi:hypothetical protein
MNTSMESKEIRYNQSLVSKVKSEWVKPILYMLPTSFTHDTPENCAPTKFGGTGDSLGPSGPDCGPPIS